MEHLSNLIEVVKANNFVVLDTETTGIDHDSEIVQIAIIDNKGRTLLNSLVKPSGHIPSGASNIHGITDDKVADSPTIDQLWPEIIASIKGKDVIIYNANYDAGILRSAEWALSFPTKIISSSFDWAIKSVHCAMLSYGEFSGSWNSEKGGYRWHKLAAACQRQNIVVENAHDALGDCLMTLALVRDMEAKYSGWLDRREAMATLLEDVSKELLEMETVHENELVQQHIRKARMSLGAAGSVLK